MKFATQTVHENFIAATRVDNRTGLDNKQESWSPSNSERFLFILYYSSVR